MTKSCTICKKEFSLENFNKNRKYADGLSNVCRDCNKEKSREYYRKNRDSHVRVTVQRGQEYIQECKQKVDRLLSRFVCPVCGNNDTKQLAFCYEDGSKSQVNYLVTNRKPWQRITEEIKKCVITCVLCRNKNSTKTTLPKWPLNKQKALEVIRNSKKADKRKNRECDLDLPFVMAALERPCQYCGATKDNTQLGLDRIDNSIGHVKTNVVTACSRCNYMRRDMPYEAWVLLVPAMKAAYEKNLLNDWTPFYRGKAAEEKTE